MSHNQDRRSFINSTLGLGSFALLGGCRTTGSKEGAATKASDSAGGLRIRNALTSPAALKDIELYKKAITLLKKAPAPVVGNVWTAQAVIHNTYCTHNNWFFLPWHRHYLVAFETVCRDALAKAGESTDFSIPYWNWPDTHLKIPDIMWGEGNPLYDNTREMGPNDTLESASCGAGILKSIVQVKNFIDFGGDRTNTQQGPSSAGMLEGAPHNRVHATISGDMGNFMSPLDPVFWMHHANVDRLWATWQAAHPNLIPSNPAANDPNGKAGDGTILDANFWLNFVLAGYEKPDGSKFTAVVKDCLDTTKMSLPYIYDTLTSSSLALTNDTAAALAAAPNDSVYVEAKNVGLVLAVDQDNKIIRFSLQIGAVKSYIDGLSNDPRSTGCLSLIIDHIPVPDDSSAHYISLEFFMNYPGDLTPETDSSDIHFLTAYSFFVHNHDGASPTMALRVELNQAFIRMRDNHEQLGDSVVMQVIVRDRRLEKIPNLTTFSSQLGFRLVYVES